MFSLRPMRMARGNRDLRGHEIYQAERIRETWYACPNCEADIPVDRLIMTGAK